MDINTNDLLAEILKSLPPQLQPDEVTASMLAKAGGYSPNGARQHLAKLEKDGVLTKHEAIFEGKIVTAYRKKG